jgi:acetyl esterase/lipase
MEPASPPLPRPALKETHKVITQPKDNRIRPGRAVPGQRSGISIPLAVLLLLGPALAAQETWDLWTGTAPHSKENDLVRHVTGETPPAFLLHAYDDEVVPVEESLAYARALRAAGQEVEMHLFARGRHGFGPGRPEDGTAQWLALLTNWIKRQSH